jgi:hypothetical protein
MVDGLALIRGELLASFQHNGLIERAHRHMKEVLKARLAGNRLP